MSSETGALARVTELARRDKPRASLSPMAMKPMTAEQLEQVADESAYWRERDMAFDHDHCFLCGVALSDKNPTEKQSPPKWMERL